MVAHFCHLHSMAIKFSCMAYLWPMYGFSGWPCKMQPILLSDSSNFVAWGVDSEMVPHFCNLHYMAIKKNQSTLCRGVKAKME